jgi:hypothetical protein
VSGTPDGAPEGSDNSTEEIDSLDSALEAAWNTEGDDDEGLLADEQADDDTDADDSEDDESDDVEHEESEEAADTEDDEELFTVKVDGEEIQVSLAEALAGYSRHADYTRKTQALAEKAERYAAFESLATALRENPQDTITKLARLYEVDFAAEQDTDDPLEDLPPALAQEIRELRGLREEWAADRASREAAERAAAIDREVEAIRVKYDATDLDEGELIQFAIDHQVMSLDAAYRLMRAERAEAAKQAKTEKRVERKRKAPPVEGGRNRKGVQSGVSDEDMTLEAAWEMALAAAQ